MKSKKQAIKELKRKLRISLVELDKYRDIPMTKDNFAKIFKKKINILDWIWCKLTDTSELHEKERSMNEFFTTSIKTEDAIK